MLKHILFSICVATTMAFNSSDCFSSGHEKWLCRYMDRHSKIYSSHADFLLRKIKLEQALVKRGHGDVSFGPTSRSDIFDAEKQNNNALKLKRHKFMVRRSDIKHKNLEQSARHPIDWRNYNGIGYTTDVKDQGTCGGCFAFAAASVLEFWSTLKHGHPKSLSAQNILDCTSGTNRPNVGCDGGLMEYVFEYAKHHPIVLDTDSPFKESLQQCPRKKLWSHVAVENYRVLMIDDNPKAESQFEHILHKYGPISVGVDSSNMDDYRNGIFQASMCSNDIDHAVTIVGYTKDAWIVKNSWGTGWGDDGYFYLERGKNACGVAEYAVYVELGHEILNKMPTHWSFTPT